MLSQQDKTCQAAVKLSGLPRPALLARQKGGTRNDGGGAKNEALPRFKILPFPLGEKLDAKFFIAEIQIKINERPSIIGKIYCMNPDRALNA